MKYQPENSEINDQFQDPENWMPGKIMDRFWSTAKRPKQETALKPEAKTKREEG